MVARRGIEAPSRRHPGVTPERPAHETSARQEAMATVTLTARYLDQLKSHGKATRCLTRSCRDWRSACRRRAARRSRVLPAPPPDATRRAGAIRTCSWKRRGRSRRSIAAASLTALIPQARSRPSTRRTRTRCRRSTSCIAGEEEGPAQLVRGPPHPGEGSPPTWRHRRVADIRRRDIRELVEQKAQTAPIQGNRVLERISALFTFAVDQDWIEANPAWRIENRDRNAVAIACSRATNCCELARAS